MRLHILRVRMVEQDLAVPFEFPQSHVCHHASQAKFRQKSSTIGDSFPHGSSRRKHKHLASGDGIASTVFIVLDFLHCPDQ